MRTLRGVRVIVAGGGLAGLSAAYELSRHGAEVHLVEARDRLGGRVWTMRDSRNGVHVEAGGEFIDGDQAAIRDLAKSLGLPLIRILRDGFGSALSIGGRLRVRSSHAALWNEMRRLLRPVAEAFAESNCDWSSAAAAVIARRSVRDLLQARRATPQLVAMADAMRGFYLAEPDQLSSLVVVEQTLSDGAPGQSPIYRIAGGNDRIVHALAEKIRGTISLRTAVRLVAATAKGVRVTVDNNGTRTSIDGHYAVLALPAPLLRECELDPPLDDVRQTALRRLDSGPATKAFLQFATRWWRRSGRPRAFGTNLPMGAIWEAAEEQANIAMLTMLGGGGASQTLQERLNAGFGHMKDLEWLGRPEPAHVAFKPIVWEREPWSRGGYAVFGPDFDPKWRPTLSQNHGRVFFAGEHASARWQGFMNGAVESGLDGARNIERVERLRGAIPSRTPND
jgi:monoamine oxidase